MTRSIRTTRRLASAVALAAAVLVGCAEDSPDKLIASGKDFMAKQDFKAAEIQFKSALQKDPTLAEARFLLGSALLRTGDYASAEKEFRRALEYRYSAEQVYPLLARAIFRQSNIDVVRKGVGELRDVNLRDPAAAAALKNEVAYAYIALGQPKDARNMFERALALRPGDPGARIGLARFQANDGDLDGAMKAVQDVLATSPGLAEALALKAELHLARNEIEPAAAALREVVKVDPLNVGARTTLVSALIGERRFDEAAAELAAMRKAMPGDLRGRYLEAVLEFRRGQPQKAKDAILQVLKVAPDHLPSLLLAGVVDYQLGQFGTAEEYLRRVIVRSPDQLYARTVLALTLLRLGQPAKANEVIQPALARGGKSPFLLRAAGEVAFANNDPKRAAELYERAVAQDQGNAGARVRLGVARLAAGDPDAALRELESAAQMDPDSTQADLGRIATHISRREYDKALAVAEALVKKQPKSALAEHARGSILLARGDRKSARASFEKALDLQFDYLPAALSLARLDIADKEPAVARQRFEAIVAKSPKNEQALLLLAQMQLATGATAKDVVPTVDRAVAANPASPNARLSQISILLRAQNPKAALNAAQSAAAALPENPAIIEALGRAQLAAGEPQQAVSTFNRLGTLAPQSSVPLLLAARAHLANKDVDAATQALRKALDLNPNQLNVHREAISTLLAAGKPQDALAEARTIQKARPKEPVGFVFEGEVLAAQKKFNEAANAYAEALKRQQAPVLALRLSGLLTQAGKAKEGEALLARWVRENPKDLLVPLYLADRALAKKDYKAAVPMYRRILEVQPENVIVLNNLAWTLGQLKDPEALKLAEKAHGLAPNNPAVADTLGVILVERGDLQRGVKLLQEAVEAAPNAPDLRLHYAQALLKLGDKASARRHLQEIANAPGESAAKTAALELLKQL